MDKYNQFIGHQFTLKESQRHNGYGINPDIPYYYLGYTIGVDGYQYHLFSQHLMPIDEAIEAYKRESENRLRHEMMWEPLVALPYRESPVVFMIGVNQGEDLMEALKSGNRQITSGDSHE